MTTPFYAYQQGKNKLSAGRFAPEPTDIVVGVHPSLPDHGITVRLEHAHTSTSREDAISVVLPVDEAVAFAMGVLTEVGTLAAQQIGKTFNDLGLKLPQEEKD